MNYIYDILLNYNCNFYEVFEWNKEDNIMHIRKIPLFKINTKTLYDFIHSKIKLEDCFLSRIYQKAEMFAKNRINTLNYCFLASNGEEVVAFKCNCEGIIIEYSKLLLEEEAETLEYIETVEKTDILYQIISDHSVEPFKTRNELQIKDYILSEVQKIVEDKDTYKLQYLYLDCFNKTVDVAEIIDIFYNELENNWEEVYVKIYSFLKMTTSKK